MSNSKSDDDKAIVVEQKDSSEADNADDEMSSCESSSSHLKGPMVKFVSEDGQFFFVEEKVSRKFKLRWEIPDESGDGKTRNIRIKSPILAIMIKWAEHHINDPETKTDAVEDDEIIKRTDDIAEWDNELLDLKTETLFDLMEAARISHMEGLLNVACKKVAGMIKGKDCEGIRTLFNLDRRRMQQESS